MLLADLRVRIVIAANPLEIEVLVKRLARAFGKYLPKGEETALVALWRDELARLDRQAIVEEFEYLMDAGGAGKRFPTLPDFKAAVYRRIRLTEGREAARHHAAGSDICPTCRTPWTVAGYQMGMAKRDDGPVLGRLRCRCPQTGRGWDTPRARAWRDTGPNLPPRETNLPDPVFEPGDAKED